MYTPWVGEARLPSVSESMRILTTVIIAATVAVYGAGCTRHPNVVLISIDSLRADHVGAYGYERDTTPVMDQLAAEGALFRRTVSTTSWTLPAHAALFTGQPDSVHGVVMPYRRLGAKASTLAEHFSASGYETTGFYAGPFLHPVFGFGQGFDDYVDCTSYGLGGKMDADSDVSARAIRESHAVSHGDVTNPTVLKSFVDALDKRGNRPFFYFVHLWDVHYDFIPPPPYDRMFDPDYDGKVTGEHFRYNELVHAGMPERDLDFVLSLYDGEIRFTDDTIGSMIAALDERGLGDRTIIAITSDHGEEFFEHGEKGHRNTLYEEVLHIPLIVWYPRKIRPVEVEQVTGIIDVAPTLVDLAGLEPMDTAVGISLVPAMRTSEATEPRPYLSELRAPPMSAVRLGDEKLIVDNRTGTFAYFDLAKDPGERNPIVEPGRHEVVTMTRLVSAMKKKYDRLGKKLGDAEEAQVDEQTTEELRSLGYLD